MAAQRTESWELIVGYSLYFDSVSIFHFRFSSFARYWCANITTGLEYSVQFSLSWWHGFFAVLLVLFQFRSLRITCLVWKPNGRKRKIQRYEFLIQFKNVRLWIELNELMQNRKPNGVACHRKRWRCPMCNWSMSKKKWLCCVCVCAINSCRKRWTDIKLLGLRNKRADRQHIEIEWITNQYAN